MGLTLPRTWCAVWQTTTPPLGSGEVGIVATIYGLSGTLRFPSTYKFIYLRAIFADIYIFLWVERKM
jgi:hypothetical protein